MLGLSDLTRTEEALPDLEGLLAWIACIGDALPVEHYSEILHAAGVQLETVEDQGHALTEMVRQIQGKLLGAEIMAALNKIVIRGIDFALAKQFARGALDATRRGKLGYAVVIAHKT